MHSRRILLKAVVGTISLSLVTPLVAFGQGSGASSQVDLKQPVLFEWELPRETAKQVQERLAVPSLKVMPAPGAESDRTGPVVVILVGVLAVGLLAETIMSVYRDMRYGGIIVEDTGKTLSIKNDPRLPGRVILIKDKQGVKVLEASGSPTLKEVVQGLSKLNILKSGKPDK